MHLSLVQLAQSCLCVFVSFRHVLIDSLQLLSLSFSLDSDIFCDLIDVRHYVCYRVDVLLSLLDHVVHEVDLACELYLLGRQLVTLFVCVFAVLRNASDHKIFLIRVLVCVNDARGNRRLGEISVHLCFFLDFGT